MNNNNTESKKTELPDTTDSQKLINLILKDKLKKADSVVLISHIGLDFDAAKEYVIPEILINGKLNKKIIKERKIITGNNIDSLIKIALLPTNSGNLIFMKCFEPHHSILIFNDNKISYIDMCFHCWELRTSEDLDQIIGYEMPKWNKMFSFFKRMGFKYEMLTE